MNRVCFGEVTVITSVDIDKKRKGGHIFRYLPSGDGKQSSFTEFVGVLFACYFPHKNI